MFQHADLKHYRAPRHTAAWWFLGTLAALAFLAIGGALARHDARVEVAAIAEHHLTRSVRLSDCPPKQPGDTDVLTITVNASADGKVLTASCLRYRERGARNAPQRLLAEVQP